MANKDLIKKRGTYSKKIVLNVLKKIKKGSLEINDGDERYMFGTLQDHRQHAVLTIKNPRAYKKFLIEGTLGAGKSYMEGDWTTSDLKALIELILINDAVFNSIESPFARLLIKLRAIGYKLNKNSVTRAKDNILAHYDLSNDFFQLILDPSMMYSCALYDPPGISLDEAATKKLQKICQKLDLKQGDHVLEIGTGWGGFAFYAAKEYGCKITTTTISDKQYAFVNEKIKSQGLENQIELLNMDYRKLTSQYDKVVSIEMIEAVGHKFFDTFFRTCNHLLKPKGLFFLQAIIINDRSFEAAKNEVDFIKKYIFPGGCLPSLLSISKSIATQTTMQLMSLDDIGMHYVNTLNDWHNKLLDREQAILAQGFNDNFIRMWQFYFCYCAAGFASSHISTIHALWRKRV